MKNILNKLVYHLNYMKKILFLFLITITNNAFSFSDVSIFYNNTSSLFGTSSTPTTISSNQSITGGTVNTYGSLTINSGVTLTINDDGISSTENPTVFIVNGTLTINGSIVATQGSHSGGTFSKTISGITFIIKETQQAGGNGGNGACPGNGSLTLNGHGGGGGGGCSAWNSLGGDAGTPSFTYGGWGGNGANGSTSGAGGAYIYAGYSAGGAGGATYGASGSAGAAGSSSNEGSGGGGGGAHGYHGGIIIILAKNIVGNGSFDLHGSNGGVGGNGGSSSGNYRGGSGGGGAGGNGGTIILGTTSNSFTGTFNLNPGSGGNAGTLGTGSGSPTVGTPGSAGTYGRIVNIHL